MTSRKALYQNSADLREFHVLPIISGLIANQAKTRNSIRNYVTLSKKPMRKGAGFWDTDR